MGLGMEEDEVRFYLLKNYEDKSKQHIKNIYAILASAFGIILSGKLDIFPEGFSLNVFETAIIAFFPILYFFLRALYWNARIWQTKKISLNVEPSSTLIHIFEKSVSEEIAGYKGIIPWLYRSTNKYSLKFLFWFFLPSVIYILFYYF